MISLAAYATPRMLPHNHSAHDFAILLHGHGHDTCLHEE